MNRRKFMKYIGLGATAPVLGAEAGKWFLAINAVTGQHNTKV